MLYFLKIYFPNVEFAVSHSNRIIIYVMNRIVFLSKPVLFLKFCCKKTRLRDHGKK
jgi:hypothetical protein